jgi:hypothetical protein
MFNYTESLHWGPHPSRMLFYYHFLKMIARKKFYFHQLY